jgi:hypothetical protein
MFFLVIIRCRKTCTSPKNCYLLSIWSTRRLMCAKITAWFFYKEHKNEKKCLQCGKLRFVEVVNKDGEMVTMKTAHKQLHYMPLTPRMKSLFISKKIARHMMWHKEGVRENDQVMVHPSDSEAWKARDDSNPDLARDARKVHIGLAIDGFTLYNTSASSYSCWPVFAISYNLPPALWMKYEYMFLCLIIPGPDHTGPSINVMLKPLIEELKQLWQGVETYHYDQKKKNSTFELRIGGRSIILRRTIFFQDGVAMDFWHVQYVWKKHLVSS